MIRLTLALLAVAEFADFASSWYAMAHGTREANPFFLAAGSAYLPAFVVAKLGVVPIVGALIGNAPTPRAERIICAATRFAATMLLGVAASNVLAAL